jgi:hypothetical protein
MGFGEHLRAALERFASDPLNEQEMRELKAFMIGIDAVVKQQTGQGEGGPMGGEMEEEEAAPDNGTSEYGAGSNTAPKTQGNVPYGSAY